jgi:hypothetical protein
MLVRNLALILAAKLDPSSVLLVRHPQHDQHDDDMIAVVVEEHPDICAEITGVSDMEATLTSNIMSSLLSCEEPDDDSNDNDNADLEEAAKVVVVPMVQQQQQQQQHMEVLSSKSDDETKMFAHRHELLSPSKDQLLLPPEPLMVEAKRLLLDESTMTAPDENTRGHHRRQNVEPPPKDPIANELYWHGKGERRMLPPESSTTQPTLVQTTVQDMMVRHPRHADPPPQDLVEKELYWHNKGERMMLPAQPASPPLDPVKNVQQHHSIHVEPPPQDPVEKELYWHDKGAERMMLPAEADHSVHIAVKEKTSVLLAAEERMILPPPVVAVEVQLPLVAATKKRQKEPQIWDVVMQPDTPKEAALKAKYAAIEDLGERCFTILVDLGYAGKENHEGGLEDEYDEEDQHWLLNR